MIMAEKIIQLRKKNGWSQEDLAAELGVSRQAISKWESAQSIPDITRILDMSKIFSVSTDFLVKDELEMSDATTSLQEPAVSDASPSSPRVVSMEEAVGLLDVKTQSSKLAAWGTALCIFGAAFLVLFTFLIDFPGVRLSENLSLSIGMVGMVILVGTGVAALTAYGMRVKPFEYLEKEPFETAYGVDGMAKQRREKFHQTYVTKLFGGGLLCMAAVVMVLLGSMWSEDSSGNTTTLVSLVPAGVAVAGVAVYLLISASIPMRALRQLLQEESVAAPDKRSARIIEPISTAYWLIVLAVFLAYGFISKNWGMSWVIFPVALALYGALVAILHAILDNKSDKYTRGGKTS